MGRHNRRWVGFAVIGAASCVASAQSPFQLDAGVRSNPAPVEIGGTQAVDIIHLRPVGPGSPLRFGGVIAKSERVTLDNEVLTPDTDYFMDYATGVVYLKRAQRAGQTMIVSYRYNPKASPTGGSQFAGLGAMKYTLVPGGMNLLMGMGLTERGDDGSVLQNNLFGFSNGFGLGGGSKLSGIFMSSNRDQVAVQTGLNTDRGAKLGGKATDAGHSQLILQNLTSNVLGGQASFTYQDVGKNFTSFGAVQEGGTDAARVNQLKTERGLTRYAGSLAGVRFGSSLVDANYGKVGDDKGALQWRKMGLQQGTLSLDYSSQSVDSTFGRFKDIAEADRAQLEKEKGINRQSFAAKLSALSYGTSTIEDTASGMSVVNRQWGLDASKFKLLISDRVVDGKFNRFDSLMAPEKAQYGREAGITRRMANLSTTMFGAGLPMAYSEQSIKNDTGSFASKEGSIAGKGWSLSHSDKATDTKFVRMDALQDAEMDQHIRSVANMYGPGIATTPNDRATFLKGQGVSRAYDQVKVQPFKNWDVSVDRLRLKGQTDDAKLDTLALSGGGTTMNYRHESLGKRFFENTTLMAFETARLGAIGGLDRTDFGLSMKLGKTKTVTMSKMDATVGTDTAARQTLAYAGGNVDLQVNQRKVGSGFASASQLVDPEKDLLNSLRGFKETDVKFHMQALPSLKFDFSSLSAINDSTHEQRATRAAAMDWTPDKNTHFTYNRLDQKNDDPLSVLFSQSTERMWLSRNLGTLGTIQVLDERLEYAGRSATAPDAHRQYLAYETKIDNNTSVKTEQTRVSFSDGTKEDTSANTVSTTISKRAGVSVTDTKVDRTGDEKDETKRNYGFWFDLGNGMRLSYGYNRNMSGLTTGTMNSTLSLGQSGNPLNPDQMGQVKPGQLGDWNVGGGYGVNQWDQTAAAAERTQTFSNVSLASAKALRVGMFQDLKFNLNMDTAADYSNWVRENRLYGIAGRVGSNQFGYEYRSQMDKSGMRAIDRSFRLQTDQNEKKKLAATVFYKVRTLPTNDQYMIRSFDIRYRPLPNIELANQIQTNPEIANTNVLLGSVPQASKSNKWRLDYKRDPNFIIGGSWEELVNDQAKTQSQVAGLNITLFQKTGSPLSIFYGMEDQIGASPRRTTTRYHIQYDRKASKNQVFSLFLGNVSYEHSIADGFNKDNWTARLDWQVKF